MFKQCLNELFEIVSSSLARQLLPNKLMRAFLIFVIVAGLGFVFLRQKQSETASSQAKPVVTQSPSVQLTPAPRGQASQYNYMKRALDRAADVRDQARAQTDEAQKP